MCVVVEINKLIDNIYSISHHHTRCYGLESLDCVDNQYTKLLIIMCCRGNK